MAISAGMALMSTATGLVTGGTLAFGTTLAGLGLGAAVSHFLVTTAIYNSYGKCSTEERKEQTKETIKSIRT
jgi:hypothetical protein